MTKEIRRLVAEMCVGMFLYVLALGILAVIFRRGLAGMGFALGPIPAISASPAPMAEQP